MFVCVCVYIYIYICVCVCVCMYLSTHKDPGMTNSCTWPLLKDILYMSTTHSSQNKIMTLQ